MPSLSRSNCAGPGITRVRQGRGFSYRWPDGSRVGDPEVRSRIAALAIPPAWTEVWICPKPNGHLQAVGTDDAGRRQYRYHNLWTQERSDSKHERMLELAARLPPARETVDQALALPRMPVERALAVAFRLLDHGFFRVGSESYRAAHGTFGLATLRRDQVDVSGPTISFHYTAKGGAERDQRLVDPDLVPAVRSLLRRRDDNPELLAWRDGTGWHDVRSADVNAYIREITRGDFTAKDFRTWNATVLMAQALAVSIRAPQTQAAQRRAVVRAVAEVADYLGNTPAVARKAYVDPRIIDLFLDGVTVDLRTVDRSVASPGLAIHGPLERAVLRLLRNPRRPGARSVSSRRSRASG